MLTALRVVLGSLLALALSAALAIVGQTRVWEGNIALRSSARVQTLTADFKERLDGERRTLKSEVLQARALPAIRDAIQPLLAAREAPAPGPALRKRLAETEQQLLEELQAIATRGYGASLLGEDGVVLLAAGETPYQPGVSIANTVLFADMRQGFLRDALEAQPVPIVVVGTPIRSANNRRSLYLLVSRPLEGLLRGLVSFQGQSAWNDQWALTLGTEVLAASTPDRRGTLGELAEPGVPFPLERGPATIALPLAGTTISSVPLLMRNPGMCGLIAVQQPVDGNVEGLAVLMAVDTRPAFSDVLLNQLWAVVTAAVTWILLSLALLVANLRLNKRIERLGDYLATITTKGNRHRESNPNAFGRRLRRLTILINKLAEQASTTSAPSLNLASAPTIEQVLAAQALDNAPRLGVGGPLFATPASPHAPRAAQAPVALEEESSLDPDLLAGVVGLQEPVRSAAPARPDPGLAAAALQALDASASPFEDLEADEPPPPPPDVRLAAPADLAAEELIEEPLEELEELEALSAADAAADPTAPGAGAASMETSPPAEAEALAGREEQPRAEPAAALPSPSVATPQPAALQLGDETDDPLAEAERLIAGLSGATPVTRAPATPSASPPPTSAPAASSAPATSPGDPDAEARHLFDQFMAARQQTGEGPGDLTFDKFMAKVAKTKATILAQQACKDVRFAVHVKDGKAALKATPIRT